MFCYSAPRRYYNTMSKSRRVVIAVCFTSLLFVAPVAYGATLRERIPEAFLAVYGRQPTASELSYGQGRVDRKEKTTYEALAGAMGYQQSAAATIPVVSGALPLAADDKTSMIKVVLPLFISIYGSDPSAAEKAWWRKRISCNELKNYQALVASMRYHHAKKARQGSPNVCRITTA